MSIAEAEGWEAVTTRRVADEIDYSQPVIYQHFSGRDGLMQAIAVNGFGLLVAELRAVVASAAESRLEALCSGYISFGSERPRLYEAMFSNRTSLQFASVDTPVELRAAFNVLRETVALTVTEPEVDSVAELTWAACHGIVTLLAAGRIPSDHVSDHVVRIAGFAARTTQRS